MSLTFYSVFGFSEVKAQGFRGLRSATHPEKKGNFSLYIIQVVAHPASLGGFRHGFFRGLLKP